MEWRLGKATQVQKWHQLLWGQSKGPSPESPQGLSQLLGTLGLSMFLGSFSHTEKTANCLPRINSHFFLSDRRTTLYQLKTPNANL